MAFREGFVEADGFRIRYLEAGEGSPLMHLHGAGGLRLHGAHEALSRKHRMILFEMPGFGTSAENTRTQSQRELAGTMHAALAAMGIEQCNLWGTSFGGRVVLWMAADQPDRVPALVLEAPGAIRPEGHRLPGGTPEEMRRLIFAHPERLPPMPPPVPAIAAKNRALAGRLRGPDRDPALEARMREIGAPTLVLFGTLDRVMPPEMGRRYKELLPDCHLVFLYDAGHEMSTERPDAFSEVVGDFLERHEAFVISRTPTVIHP